MVIYFLSFFLCFIQQTQEQQITGRVVDTQNKPLEFANVALYALPDTTLIMGTITDTEGRFTLATRHSESKAWLQVSFVGYQDFGREIASEDYGTELQPIVLHETFLGIKEITIIAEHPAISSRNGILTTTVANTLLAKEHSVYDVLSKVPGLINNKGTIEVFGSGRPVYYINNRKVKNKDEIGLLNVQNIQKIELITNPGATYDADVNAVIKIYTLRKESGWSVLAGAYAAQSEKFSHWENIRIGYKNEKLNASAYYSFYDYRNKAYQYLIKEIHADTVRKYTTDRTQLPVSKIHNYSINTDYEIRPNQIAGFQITGSRTDNRFNTHEQNSVEMNRILSGTFQSPNDTKDITDNVQFNMFHNAQWNDRLSSSLNMDYVCYRDNREQSIREIMPQKTYITDSRIRSDYDIYAAEFILNGNLNEHHSLSGGVEYSAIDGSGTLDILSGALNDSRYTSHERKYAGFMEYTFKNDALSVHAGLRYENVQRKHTDLNEAANNLSDSDSKFYPSATLSYTKNGISNSLSFSAKTARPALSYLNGRTYYQNRFLYQKGNPNLKPQTSYILEWIFGYRWITFRTSYTQTNDFISDTFVDSPSIDPSVIVSTWQNFKKAEYLKANLTMRHSFGFWHPSLSAGMIQPYLSSVYLGETIHYNHLNFYIQCGNYFKLPAGYTASVNYYYNSGGSQRIFRFDPFQSLDVSVQKSFLHDRLDVKLSANDLLRKLNYYEHAKINKFTFYQNENYSQWNFSLSLIYRFNQQSLKYRGKSAAKEEKDRL